MIILDYSRLSIAGMIAHMGANFGKIELDLARHFILNSIRNVRSRHVNAFGPEFIIACDSRHYWRRDLFPYYKGNRDYSAESGIDWKALFEVTSTVKQELKTFFPYPVIEVPGAEADDIIGTFCHEHGNTAEKILIVADDKDFFQLHSYMNVQQYDPTIKKKMITVPNPERYLKEHIIRGDSGDGIPNILSDADTLMVKGKRQKPIRETKLKEWLTQNPTTWESDMQKGWIRNQELIDLEFIPQDLRVSILQEHKYQSGKDRAQLMDFFIEKRLRNLLDSIQEF